MPWREKEHWSTSLNSRRRWPGGRAWVGQMERGGLLNMDRRLALLLLVWHRLKRLLMGYQRLTSVCATLDDQEDPDAQTSRITCTAINHIHQRAVKFQVVPCPCCFYTS
jgi:hypothetical protein